MKFQSCRKPFQYVSTPHLVPTMVYVIAAKPLTRCTGRCLTLYKADMCPVCSFPNTSPCQWDYGQHCFFCRTKFSTQKQVQPRGHSWFDRKGHHRHWRERRSVANSYSPSHVTLISYRDWKRNGKGKSSSMPTTWSPWLWHCKTYRHCLHTTRKYTSPFAVKKRRNLPSRS